MCKHICLHCCSCAKWHSRRITEYRDEIESRALEMMNMSSYQELVEAALRMETIFDGIEVKVTDVTGQVTRELVEASLRIESRLNGTAENVKDVSERVTKMDARMEALEGEMKNLKRMWIKPLVNTMTTWMKPLVDERTASLEREVEDLKKRQIGLSVASSCGFASASAPPFFPPRG